MIDQTPFYASCCGAASSKVRSSLNQSERYQDKDVSAQLLLSLSSLQTSEYKDIMEASNGWSAFELEDDIGSSSKIKKKMSKKSDASGSSKKSKKKKSKRRDSDDDDDSNHLSNRSFDDNLLFAKAMANAHLEDEFALSEAFLDMKQDHEFVSAFFQESQPHDIGAFDADFEKSLSPANNSDRNEQGGDSEWVIDNESKGAQMAEYSLRRTSLLSQSSKESLRSEDSESKKQRRSNKNTSSNTSKQTKSAASRDSDVTSVSNNHTHLVVSGEGQRSQSFINKTMVDSVQFPASFVKTNNTSGDCDATIHSDLTGLTDVFPTMQANTFDDFGADPDDDSSSSDDDENADIVYPQYQQRSTKSSMMKSEQNRKALSKQKLKFGSVTVRSFSRIIGDNPSCKAGAPISIGWNVESETQHPTPEAHDAARGRTTRKSQDLVLSREDRHEMLLSLGYKDRDIAQAVRTLIKDKNRRRVTVTNLASEEKLESVASGMKRLLFRKKSSSGN